MSLELLAGGIIGLSIGMLIAWLCLARLYAVKNETYGLLVEAFDFLDGQTGHGVADWRRRVNQFIETELCE